MVAVVPLVLLLAVLVSGGGYQAQQAAPAPAPLPIRAADDAELGTLARGVTHVVGDGYIGCLEMCFSRCFADPTLVCVEDAMVECSLEAAAAPAARTTGPAAAAPLAPGGGAAAELILGAIGGTILRGVKTAGAMYIDCLEVDLFKCYSDPTMECIEKAIGAF